MQDAFADLSSRRCPPGVPISYSVDIDSSKDLGRGLIESYSRYSLGEGESLCCVSDDRGALSWYVYEDRRGAVRGAPALDRASVEKGAALEVFDEKERGGEGFIETIKTGVMIAFFSLVALHLIRSIMDAGAGSSVAPGRSGEGGALPAAPERVTPLPGESAASVDLIGRPWERTDWWRGLSDSERVIVTMIIEQDAKPAMKSSHFREMYVRDGAISEEGIKYLIDSRDGNLLGFNGMRLGPVPLRAGLAGLGAGPAGLRAGPQGGVTSARRPAGRLLRK